MLRIALLLGLIIWLPPAALSSQSIESGFIDSHGRPILSTPRNASYRIVLSYPEYMIGPGDVLVLTLFDGGDPQQERVRVLPDSTVAFSIVPSIRIGGLTVSDAAQYVSSVLSEFIRSPSVQLRVEEYMSKSASVFGSINVRSVTVEGGNSGPGRYPLKGRLSVLDLMIVAGGPTSDARLDQVKLTRGSRTYVLNLQKATEGGDNSENPFVEHGDIIRVSGLQQSDRRVAVLGEVQEPGVHELSSDASVFQAIAASNGFTQNARANRTRVIRRVDQKNPTVFTVNVDRILKGDLTQNIGLVDGDIVVVPRDWLADLNDLLTQLQPILSWGGLVVTEPLVNVGGYRINDPGVRIQTTESDAASTAAGLDLGALSGQPTVIQQVQENLRGSAGAK